VDLQFALPIDFAGDWKLFDAFNFTPHESPVADTIYSGISAMLPLTCAWDGNTGIAIALDPWNRFGELHAGARIGDAQHLLLGSRIAISPGETDELDFVIFTFDGDLGWRGAFSRFWQLFPDAYDRSPDIDPRFHMASAGGAYWSFTDPEKEEFAPDLIRRMHTGWAWGYAPAPRPGEWAVSEKSVGEWTRSRGTVKKSLSAESLPAMVESVRERADGDKADTAVAYYMHVKYVEQGLVNQYFPDAHTNDEPTEYYGYYQFVPCFQVYPWANSYGDYMTEALPSIADRFAPAGMAFDSVFGFIPEFGKAALATPATTFENGRYFVCEGIGWSMLQDIIREQNTRGYRTAMVTNLKLPTTSSNAVRTDSALIEHGPTENGIYLERFLRLRMLSGRIAFAWWHSMEPKNYKSWYNWDDLTAPQKLDMLRRIRDDLLLHSMYYGAMPNGRYMSGMPKLIKAVPMMDDMMDLGWEPVLAAEPAAGVLRVTRYGSDLGMCFGLGNQTYEPITDDLVIDLPRLADDALAYMEYAGAPTATTFAGSVARATVTVAPRNIAATRAVLALPPGTASAVRAEGHLPAYADGRLTLTVTCPAATDADLRAWTPPGVRNIAVTLAGAPIACNAADGAISFRASLQAGENALQVAWSPAIEARDTAALLDYAFVTDERPNCNIVASQSVRTSAIRVQHFFREYYRWAVADGQNIKLPMLTPDQNTGGRRVFVGLASELPAGLDVQLGDAPAAFGVSGDTVYAVAANADNLDATVRGLLATLDEKYVYWGATSVARYFFRGTPEDELPVLVEAGMALTGLTGEDTGSLPDIDHLPKLPYYP